MIFYWVGVLYVMSAMCCGWSVTHLHYLPRYHRLPLFICACGCMLIGIDALTVATTEATKHSYVMFVGESLLPLGIMGLAVPRLLLESRIQEGEKLDDSIAD